MHPYQQFPFRIRWKGRVAAGFNQVSALKRTTEWIKRSGSQQTPGNSKFEAIILSKGISQDEEFSGWVQEWMKNPSRPLRQDIEIVSFNESGQEVLSYRVFRCWVSQFSGTLDLDTQATLIEEMRLENEGWERNDALPEPQEPEG